MRNIEDHKARGLHTVATQALADELAKDGAEELNSSMINGMKLDRRHCEKPKLSSPSR